MANEWVSLKTRFWSTITSVSSNGSQATSSYSPSQPHVNRGSHSFVPSIWDIPMHRRSAVFHQLYKNSNEPISSPPHSKVRVRRTSSPSNKRTTASLWRRQTYFHSRNLNLSTTHDTKMLALSLLKDLAFSDPAKRLKQTCDNNNNNPSSGSDSDYAASGICLIGIIMAFLLFCGFLNMYRNFCESTRTRANANLRIKSTLAERKQAILELFKTSQVTMVSSN